MKKIIGMNIVVIDGKEVELKTLPTEERKKLAEEWNRRALESIGYRRVDGWLVFMLENGYYSEQLFKYAKKVVVKEVVFKFCNYILQYCVDCIYAYSRVFSRVF